MSEKKMVRKSVAIALGIICIILAFGLVGAFVYYVPLISEKNNEIASLNSQVSQLTINATNLQNQVTIQQKALNDVLNGTTTVVTVDDIALNASAWLDKAVVVGGRLSGPLNFSVPVGRPPYNYVLFRFNETSEASMVFAGLQWNSSNLYDLVNVAIIGVVGYHSTGFGLQGSGFFIKTESVILLK